MDAFLKRYSEKPKTEDIRFISEKNIFKFGKHKDKTYKEVFDNHKDYVIWILKISDPEQKKFFKSPTKYFTDRIEEENI